MALSIIHKLGRVNVLIVFALGIVIYLCASLSFHRPSTSRRLRGRSGLALKKSVTQGRADRTSSVATNSSASCGERGEMVQYITETGDFPLCVHPQHDMISDRVRKYGVWDDCEDLVWFIWNQFQGGPNSQLGASIQNRLNIIDVGANIGCCSIRLAMLGHNVLSFEPVEANFELLERNVQLNNVSSLVTIIKAGVSDASRQATAIVEAGNAGNALILNHRMDDWDIGHVEGLVRSIVNSTFSPAPVFLQLLEPHVSRLGHVDLLKLDCQGCEPAALRGAGRDALDAGRVRHVLLEFSPGHLRAAGEDGAELLGALAARGFDLATLVAGTRIPPGGFPALAARESPLLLHARHARAPSSVPRHSSRHARAALPLQQPWAPPAAWCAAGGAACAWIAWRVRAGRPAVGKAD